MARRLITYFAAFVGAFLVWIALAVIEAINPLLPWQYPFLALFMGMSFPGGASTEMHFVNHVAETWFPFLTAFVIARFITKRRARFGGAMLLYGSFLAWSLVMVWLDQLGVPLNIIFGLGLAGTFFGGAFFYVRFVDPKTPKQKSVSSES